MVLFGRVKIMLELKENFRYKFYIRKGIDMKNRDSKN